MTDKQLQLLCRGPTYVPLYHMYISPSYQSMDDMIKRQYSALKHQLTNLFAKYKIHIALSLEIHKKHYDQFKDLFPISISSDLRERALYEKILIQSICYSLKKNNLILRRTADHMNTFYIGNCDEFQMKGERYLENSNAYKVLICKNDEISHEEQQQQIKTQLKEMIESMNLLLEELRKYKSLDNKTIDRLRLDLSKVQLPYAYFLPDISKVRYNKWTSLLILLNVLVYGCIRKINCLSHLSLCQQNIVPQGKLVILSIIFYNLLLIKFFKQHHFVTILILFEN